MIKYIDLQISDSCNRSCWFCPPYSNGYKNHNINLLSDSNINRLINFIKSGRSNNVINETELQIHLNRYCEPLMIDSEHKYLIGLIKKLKSNIHDITFHINTNGDFKLTKELCNNIDVIVINKYDDKISDFHMYDISTLFDDSITDFNYEVYTDSNNYTSANVYVNEKCSIYVKYDKKHFMVNNNVLSSRGNSLKLKHVVNGKKLLDCDISKHMIGIDLNGTLMPCCEISSFIDKHKDYNPYGNIFNDELNDIFNNIKYFKIEKDFCCNCDVEYSKIFSYKK